METSLMYNTTAEGLYVGDGKTGYNAVDMRTYTWDWYYPIYYPVYRTVKDNRYEVAFKIMKVFLKNGYFKKITIEKHNKMIEDIVKELGSYLN
jgi:hypothetical protein